MSPHKVRIKGITGGFHGYLRWSDQEKIEFLILQHEEEQLGEKQRELLGEDKKQNLIQSAASSSRKKKNEKVYTLSVVRKISVHLKAEKGRNVEESKLEKLMSSILNQEEPKETFATCAICQQSFSDPIVTSCGHLYCWPCIEKNKNCVCPQCRKTYVSVMPVSMRGKTKNITRPIFTLVFLQDVQQAAIGQSYSSL